VARRPDFHYRTTLWSDHRGDVEQVSVAFLAADTWEVLSEVTEKVGPFEALAVVQAVAELSATNLAERQLAGQGSFAL